MFLWMPVETRLSEPFVLTTAYIPLDPMCSQTFIVEYLFYKVLLIINVKIAFTSFRRHQNDICFYCNQARIILYTNARLILT